MGNWASVSKNYRVHVRFIINFAFSYNFFLMKMNSKKQRMRGKQKQTRSSNSRPPEWWTGVLYQFSLETTPSKLSCGFLPDLFVRKSTLSGDVRTCRCKINTSTSKLKYTLTNFFNLHTLIITWDRLNL